MNDEEFEMKLKAIEGSLNPSDPTPGWRAEIVSHALCQVGATQFQGRIRPPHWLMASWGVAWAAVLVMHFITPSHSILSDSRQINVASVTKMDPTTETLLAYNRRLTLNLDLP